MWLRRYWFPIPLAFLLVGVLTSSGPVIALSVFVMGAGYVARRWADHVFDNVRYERLMPENRAFPGERLRLTLRLTNDKLLPVPWIELRDAFPETMPIDRERLSPSTSPGQVYLRRSTHLAWYERVNWQVELDAPARGYYRIGPARLTSGDIFGFFPEEHDVETTNEIIVYPRTYELVDLGLPAERPFGERRGGERIFEDPTRFAGLRDYRPEDSLRRIDWKASARRQALQSRVFDPSSTFHLLVALNVHTLERSWQGYVPEELERLLSAAGSVARWGFEAGYAVGLVANGAYRDSDRPMRVPVGRGPDQLRHVLEALAVIGPLTMVSLPAVIDREAQSFPFGATLVCVTARMGDDLAASLVRVARAGHTVTVLSLAAEPFREDLGPVRVLGIRNAMISLEARQADSEPVL